MGHSFGGFLVQLREPAAVPRPLEERYADPDYDDEADEPDGSRDLLRALYGDRVERTEITAHVHQASSRNADRPFVAFHGRCVVVFDTSSAMSCDWEAPEARRSSDLELVALSRSVAVQRLMVFTLESVSDSYGFAVYERGERTRRWASIPSPQGTLLLDEGRPLPSEPAGQVHGQDRIVAASRTLFEDHDLMQLAGEHDGPVYECELRPTPLASAT